MRYGDGGKGGSRLYANQFSRALSARSSILLAWSAPTFRHEHLSAHTRAEASHYYYDYSTRPIPSDHQQPPHPYSIIVASAGESRVSHVICPLRRYTVFQSPRSTAVSSSSPLGVCRTAVAQPSDCVETDALLLQGLV